MATIDVDFDPADYLDEVSTKELQEELTSRKVNEIQAVGFRDVLAEIEECLFRRDINAALVEIQKALTASWSKKDAAYRKATETRDPQSGRPVIQ